MRTILLIGLVLSIADGTAAISDERLSALDLCHRAEIESPQVAAELVERGVLRAEEAIATHPEDPVAHFALFCNLAKRLQIRGFHLGVVGELRRLQHVLDRSLELDPAYAEAIAAKGALLFYAPRLAGGDVGESERLLRRALDLDPASPVRLVLVDLLAYRGDWDRAREQVRIWMRTSRSAGDSRLGTGAESVIGYVCGRARRSYREAEVLSSVC